jgi:plastocyanin
VGTKTWTVTLKAGKYTYVCDPHASFMKGSFTVT